KMEFARPYEIVLDPEHRPLTGQVAVVTGASGTIGRAIAVRLAADGARVVAVARDARKLEALMAEVAEFGGRAGWERVDLADGDAVHDLAKRVGPIDILVNNAGGSSRAKNAYVWEQSVEVIDEILA